MLLQSSIGGAVALHGDVVRIELLLIAQCVKMRFDTERDDGGWIVSQVVAQRCLIYTRSHVPRI